MKEDKILAEIPGTLQSKWIEEYKAVVDTWFDYRVDLEKFKQAIMKDALDHATQYGAIAWILDSSRAEGSLPQEVQEYLSNEGSKIFESRGIQIFIIIDSKISMMANISEARIKLNSRGAGRTPIIMASLEEAILWLKEQA